MGENRDFKVKRERLMKLSKLIKELDYPSSSKLAKILECHPSTIKRDVTFLRDRHYAPIEYDPHKKGFYYTDETFKMKDVLLTESELFAITTMIPLMEQYKNTPLENSFRSVFEKISEMLPTDQLEISSSFIEDVQFIAEPAPKIDPQVFTTVFQAIREKKTIVFQYKSNKSTEYTVNALNPYKVLCNKASWYVYGFSHKHKEYRTFAFSRIKECDFSKDITIQNANENIDELIHIDPHFGVWDNHIEPMKIELLFDADRSTYITEREWHPNQECHQNEDGSVYLSFTTNQIQTVMSWILSFGSKVKVLNPPELKDKIRDEILKVAEQFKE